MGKIEYRTVGPPFKTLCYNLDCGKRLMSNKCLWENMENIFGDIRSFCNEDCYQKYLEQTYNETHCAVCDKDLRTEEHSIHFCAHPGFIFCDYTCADKFSANEKKIKAQRKQKREEKKWTELRRSSISDRFKLMEID